MAQDVSTYRNISRSALEREIEGKYGQKLAGQQILSINGTSVYSTFVYISNVAQCIFYDYIIWYRRIYIVRRAYIATALLTDINSF